MQFPIELLERVALLIVILIVTWVSSLIVGKFISKATSRISPIRIQEVKHIVTYIIWFIGISIGLEQLGLELNLLFVIVGFVGVMLVIASRDVLLNFVSREIIIIYHPFKIGDWIQIAS